MTGGKTINHLNCQGYKNGFTLIELLVVVAIIGILAAAAIPQVMGAICKARTARIQSDIRAVRTAIKQALIDDESITFSDIAAHGFDDDKPELKPYLPKQLWKGNGTMTVKEGSSSDDRIIMTLPEDCEWTDDAGNTCSGTDEYMSYNFETGRFECYSPF